MDVSIVNSSKNNIAIIALAVRQQDARHFQILAQFSFLVYGILFLNWNEINTYLFLMVSCLAVQAIGIALQLKITQV